MTLFSHIIGNQWAKEYLARIAARNSVAHSLLFTGPDGIGKGLFAEAFARLILSSDVNPYDLHIYRPEGKIGMHSVDAMRQFTEEVYLPPYKAKKKVCIIHDAERMLSYSSNALLKTFEEPALHTIIILVTSSPEALLPTVLSRCSTVRFRPIEQEKIALFLEKEQQLPLEKAQMLAARAHGSLGTALALLRQEGDPLRKRILDLLSSDPVATYIQLVEASQEVAQYIEEKQGVLEEERRMEMKGRYPDGMPSAQQHGLEKEIEGVLAMRFAQQVRELFVHILGWYRDMQLLYVRGNPAYLFHPDYRAENAQALQRGRLLPLEVVQKAMGQAELALARSTPLSTTLENLLLQLVFFYR